jgi:hypothetical protein
MKAQAPVAKGLAGAISDTLCRKLVEALNARPIFHAMRGKFRACEKHLSKQHAPRVESNALWIRHALGDESVAGGGAWWLMPMHLGVLLEHCRTRKIQGSKS